MSFEAADAKIDPTEFDITIAALLVGLGAEKYVDIFRKRNIGQCTLAELTNEDLIKLGVDDELVRKKLLEEVKNLPLYEESALKNHQLERVLNPEDVADIFEESSQHVYRIYLSIMANTLALKKIKNVPDSLLYEDKYASDIALCTISEINCILNSMDTALHMHMKGLVKKSRHSRNKKILVGTAGGAVIAVLAVLFVKSLKQISSS